MLGVGNLFWCVLLVSLTINGGIVAGQIKLESAYSGTNRTVKLGSSVDFSWNFSGDLLKVEWGTKEGDINTIDVLLFVLNKNGRLIPDVSEYKDRRSGSWNQQSPNRVMFTLNPIKGVDNRDFIFRFVPTSGLVSDVYDTVQLIVKGPPVAEIIPPALSTLRGVTASFTCNSEGFPVPNIVWMKQTTFGESEISASSVNVQINSHNGSSELIVQNTSTTDSGYYICKAFNYESDIARSFLGVVSLYEDHDLCPTNFDATFDESVQMCCPVQGFPPPQVSWELPNGTLVETGSTILHVTVKTDNDFGRYRCIARSLEKNVLEANITIYKTKSDVNDTKIILTDGVQFVWEKVQGASDYLLRLPETDDLKENSLLGSGTSTSVEIPYSSLSLKSDTKKRLLKVVIEVWAYGNSKIIGNGMHYTNVEIRASAATSTVSLMTLLLSVVIHNLQ